MRKSDRIASIPKLLLLLQSQLWYNNKYRLFFSTHHTNNPQEYWCFFLDISTGTRRHGIYRVTTDDILLTFLKVEYVIKYLANMRTYDIVMIQTTNTKNELDYMNWMGTAIPAKKGLPYQIGK